MDGMAMANKNKPIDMNRIEKGLKTMKAEEGWGVELFDSSLAFVSVGALN